MFFEKIKKTAISIVLAIACVMVTCGITSDPAYAADMGAVYGIYEHGTGWSGYHGDKTAVRAGNGSYVTAIRASLLGQPDGMSGTLSYQVNLSGTGWLSWQENMAETGTIETGMPLEAIRMELTGQLKDHYDVYYSVFQNGSWTAPVKNGETAGTSGMAKRLEAIQIKLVPKNSDTSQFEDGKKAYIKGTPTANYSTQAQEVLAQCNAQRQANGIAALSLDPELTKATNIRAQEIAALFSHTRPDGRKCFTVLDQIGYSYWSAGENIAAGYGNSSAVMNGWMNSPGHRSNILNAGFKRLGVGYVYIPNSEYGYYWVQMFSD